LSSWPWAVFAKGIRLNLSSRSILFAVLLILFLVGSNALSFPYDSTGINSTSIVRSQLQSIADEVVDVVNFDGKDRVAVFVDGEGPRTLAENAFIEAFQKRNYSLVVVDTASAHQVLHAFIFNIENTIRKLDATSSVRNIRTTVEVKMVKGAEHGVRILGTFRREAKDTAQVFMTGVSGAAQKNADTGIFQRMLTPFIVLGGAVVIVYLFFTVRS
jgi:hypothetical protein